MKQSILILAFTLASLAPAQPLRFLLSCEVNGAYRTPVNVSNYEVAKVPFKRNGMWQARYELVTHFKGDIKPSILPFVPGGSGDEDYNEYDLKATEAQRNEVGVKGAAIQNKFTWVTLVNTEGSSFARCGK